MSSVIATTFFLTGAMAGKSVNLGHVPYPFKEGRLIIQATPEDMALHARFLERNWEAYPEGHPKLKQEVENGQRSTQAVAQSDPQQQVLGNGEPNGAGAEGGEQSHNGGGAAAAQAGQAGSLPHGDGQPAELNNKLLNAVRALDPTNDDHWTADGKPAVSAVAHLYGSADVTRKDVDAVAPGYNRKAATPAEQ